MNEGPNAFLNQMIEFVNKKKKEGGTCESDKKMKTHAFIFTFRMEKRMDRDAGNLRPYTVTAENAC